MKKIFILLFLSVIATFSAQAQRKTDRLDRGVVAVYTPNKGVFVSWRIQANEYYGVKYNLYRGGTLIAENLNVSNYQDAGGNTNSTYTVRAVVNGVVQEESKSAKVWATGRVAKSSNQPAEQPNHLTIPLKDVVDRNNNIVFCCCGQHTPTEELAQNYSANDASFADLDGDGEMEIIIKRINDYDASDVFKNIYDVRYPFTNSGYYKWSRSDGKGVSQGSTTCAWNLNVSTTLVYGDGTNDNYYANLPEFNKMYITTSEGAPRLIFNKGQGIYTVVDQTEDKNNNQVAYESVVTNADGTKTYVINVRSIVTKGYAHLNAIVGSGDQSVTVTNIEYTKPKPVYQVENTTAFVIIEAYKLNGTRLWWIDCGPNMVSMNSTEINAVAYDWDEDGKAEVLLRGADNMIVHKSDGSSYTIGDPNVNTRSDFSHGTSQYAWTHTGAEYLIYLEGATATKYQVVPFPLPRFESDETGLTEQKVWSPKDANGGYGHRSSKYFFGAPVLDGRHASIFLARGIYTQTKMVALDVEPNTHTFIERWRWRNNTVDSPWFGQGNHNFSIADVDGDGCDEIIYGSMVIDNNGNGLSTTGLGHGDALHVGDLDPFRKGLEVFACNEDNPGNNFRNATTSDIYYRNTATNDDGRAMAGNFTDDYPGCIAASISSGVISTVQDKAISGLTNGCFQKPWTPMSLNGRIYWDGDLLEEAFDSPGTESEGVVSKNGTRIFQSSGCKLNNDSKNNPCAQGDILGDWREELLFRSWDNKSLHLYTTTYPTEYRIPSLWYDPEYRQAMVWQVCGYNQPPHVSFFMGEMEGLTKVPVPLTMADRTEITSDGGAFPTGSDVKDVFAYNKTNVKLPAGGASPRSLIIDVPSTVSGNDGAKILYGWNVSHMNNEPLTGEANLVKQGDGLLNMGQTVYTHSGNTDVFAGTLFLPSSSTIENSSVWMNRHTTLFTAGTVNSSVTMEYGSKLYVNGSLIDGSGKVSGYDNSVASINTLNLHEGSRVILDIDPSSTEQYASDVLNLGTLSVRKQNWQYGPEYLAPVFEFNFKNNLTPGSYPIGTLSEISEGSLDDIILEGDFGRSNDVSLVIKDGILYLEVVDNGKHFIGEDNYSTPFWGDFSDTYTIKEGYKYNIKFTNYGNDANNWNNWNLVVVDEDNYVNPQDKNYFLLRADNYGWGNYYGVPNISCTTASFDWTTFRNDMKAGADVDMDLVFANSLITVNATITSTTGNVYTYSFTSKEMPSDVSEVVAFFTVDDSYMTCPEVTEKEIEPDNVIVANTVTYDFTQGSTGKDVVYLTYDKDYANVGQSGWAYNSVYAKEVDGNVVFARLANTSKQYGFCYRYGGLLCLNQSHTLSLTELKEGSIVTVTTSANAVTESYKGNKGGAWNSSVNSDANIYTFVMTSPGDLNLLMSVGSYVYTITIVEPENLVLEPKHDDSYEAGIYGTVTVNRTFKAGYSTLCVPFNTTIEEFAPNDDEAYVAYFSGVTTENGATILEFTNGTDIEANKPYIIYVSEELAAPTVTNKPVFSESPKTITVGDWSMTGNYEVGKSMSGLYGVANNAAIMKGSSTATLNGLTAFITGPANASVKSRIMYNEVDGISNANAGDGIVTGIYNVSGAPVKSIQRGINIIRMSDGTTRKVFVK